MSSFDFDSLLPEKDSASASASIEKCFNAFKSEEENGLDIDSFTRFLSALFVDPRSGQPYHVPKTHVSQMFDKFDFNQDDIIDRQEFEDMWHKWVKVILWPVSALVVIDVQNDFISGSLSVSRCPAGHRGEEVIPVINRLIESVPFHVVVYSYDWHPQDHISFFENFANRKIIARSGRPVDGDEEAFKDMQPYEVVTFEGPPKTEQKLWPRHCVQNTWGSELHPDLKVASNSFNIYKGINSLIDSYSAFWDNNKLSETGLNKGLMERQVTDVYVSGLAYDVCVGATAGHANEYGYRTILINDACRGVDRNDITKIKSNLINKSAVIVDSDLVEAMVRGRDRRPELAYHLCRHLD